MRLFKYLLFFIAISATAQEKKWQGKFEQIDPLLPTPNEYRTGAGTPGSKYWQQRADYVIEAEIDEPKNMLIGKGTITYHNNSPEALKYLWLQLDQNVNKKTSEDFGNYYGPVRDSISTLHMQRLTRSVEFNAGYTIQSVKDSNGKDL